MCQVIQDIATRLSYEGLLLPPTMGPRPRVASYLLHFYAIHILFNLTIWFEITLNLSEFVLKFVKYEIFNPFNDFFMRMYFYRSLLSLYNLE